VAFVIVLERLDVRRRRRALCQEEKEKIFVPRRGA
jgi:hypothetical protein